MTESCGPVIPASVIAAVPPGRTRASLVCTCVCVPTTAVTRPSSHVAIATFSLVASPWKSRKTTGAARARLLDERVDHLPRRDRRVEEELAEEIEHRDAHAVPRLDDGHPVARRQRALVRGTDDAVARREVAADAAAAVRVVAERHDVGAGGEELVGELRRDPDSVGDVLAVDDREVGVVALPQRRQVLLHGAAAGGADDVGEEEDVQPVVTTGAGANFDRDVVAAVVRVLRECLLLDAREVDHGAELRRAAHDRAPDRERRICRELRHRDDERTASSAAGCRSPSRTACP